MLIGFGFIVLYVLCAGLQTSLNKVYLSHVKNTVITQFIYLLVMSGLAAICFFVLAGFDLSVNTETMLYALAAAVMVTLNMITNLICMSKVNLTMYSIAANASTLVWPTLFGVIFLNESVSIGSIVGIVLILCATLLPFVFNFKEIMADKNTKSGYIWCLLLFLICGHGTSIHKTFTASETAVGSSNAYLSWLNILMFPMMLIALLVAVKLSGKSFRQSMEGVEVKYYGFVAAGTVIGCFGMVFSFQALYRMDVSLYSPTYSSIYIIFVTLLSKFFFKEDLKKENYLAVALAIAAVICSAL